MRDWKFIMAKTIKKIKPLGSQSPHVWVIEPSFGCNLKCGHCCAELIAPEHKVFMEKEVWIKTWTILNKVSPTVRVDICGIVGEPTLHPKLTEWLYIARELAPLAQIQITTNGTMLLQDKVRYKDLLDAGANIIYTDQYGPHEQFKELAEMSGYPFYEYYNAPKDAPSPWTYRGPHIKMIVLMDHPGTWPNSRLRSGLLGNWYGNLNWEKAKRFGMSPLLRPLVRRCNQPFHYVNVAATGDYLLCCQDGMHATAGVFGNVLGGVKDFYKFWYGQEIQTIRRRLRYKNRADTKIACAKCNITFSRCDFKHWTDDEVASWWNGKKWINFEE